MNFDAVFSDETLNFVSDNEPASGAVVRVRLRAAKSDISAAAVHVTGLSDKRTRRVAMSVARIRGGFDYWEAEISAERGVSYYFSLRSGDGTYYYNKLGIAEDVDDSCNFRLLTDFRAPAWAKGAVMYQIFVDRFCRGDRSNDVVNGEYIYLGNSARHVADWSRTPETTDVCSFYGGDLQGVIDKMGYLKELGVEAVYFNPIFVSPSNHKYDIQDYDYVDPHIGKIVNDGGEALAPPGFHNRFATKYIKRTTDAENLEASNALFANLVETAHSMGIKVILDGVFNHCGAFNKWLDREGFYFRAGYPEGAYRGKASVYHDFFKWYDDAWPNNECYLSWWGYENHPKLNFEGSRELYDYILGVAKKWVSPPFNADGWRLDVAADLGFSKEFNHQFWRDFRAAVKSANPEALILAEHYGDPSEWLRGDEWDSVMNYDAFMEPLTWFLTGMNKHSEEFRGELLGDAKAFESAMRRNMARHGAQSLSVAMNQLSNHDHSRFLTRTNKTVGRLHTVGAEAAEFGVNLGTMYEAVVTQFTWPGAATIYYGDEAGLCGWTDPDNRRAFPWGKENRRLTELHRRLARLRAENSALKTGSLEFLLTEYGALAFGRWDGAGGFVVALNNTADKMKLAIPVWRIEAGETAGFTRVVKTAPYGCDYAEKEYEAREGVLELELEAFSSVILRLARGFE